MIAQVLDHLWQSTVVLSLAALLSMLLRKNRPKERYWVWFAASAKFLIPLSLFSALISRPHLLPPVGAELSAPTLQLARLSQPFLQGDWLSNAATVTSAHLPVIDISTILLSIWAAGFVALLSLWLIRWRATPSRPCLRETRFAAGSTPIAGIAWRDGARTCRHLEASNPGSGGLCAEPHDCRNQEHSCPRNLPFPTQRQSHSRTSIDRRGSILVLPADLVAASSIARRARTCL